MFRKALVFAACAVIGLLLIGGPAGAAPYPPDAPSIGTSSSSIQNAGSTTVMGTGWQPGTTVALSIASTPQSLGNALVQSDGTFSQPVTIPCLDPGTHTISGSGTSASGAADTESTTVTVTGTCSANGGGAGGTLPHTGSNASGVVTLASGLIILGAVLLIVINRRRSADL
jgi:LPXTG-motif cell wall-anchored protein